MLTIPVYYLNMLDHKYLQQNLSWSHNRGRKAKKALPAAGLYSCHPTSCCAACVLCGYWLPACNGRGGAHGDVNMSLASLRARLETRFPAGLPAHSPRRQAMRKISTGHSTDVFGSLLGEVLRPGFLDFPRGNKPDLQTPGSVPHPDTLHRFNSPIAPARRCLLRRRRTSPPLRSPVPPPLPHVAFAHHLLRTLLVLHCSAPHQVSPPLHRISLTCVSPSHRTPFLVDNGDEELHPRMEDDLTQEGSLIEDLIRLYHCSGGSSRSTRWALLM